MIAFLDQKIQNNSLEKSCCAAIYRSEAGTTGL